MSRRGAEIVFLDGRFLPVRRACVSVLDRGLLYGDGLFETLCVYRGRPFATAEHLARLRRNARRIELAVPAGVTEWERRIAVLVRRNGLENVDAAVRLTVTRGAGGGGLLPPRRGRPTIILSARRIDPGLAGLRRRGVRVVVLPFHPGFGGLLAGTKTIDYLTALVGKRFARRRGAFEGIYSAPSGEIFEGTTSNVFVVRGGKLLTPPLAAGILPGITRGLVVRLARQAGIIVLERRLTASVLARASEAFLTASTIEILPIRTVGPSHLSACPGPLTRRLQDLFSSYRAAR